MDVPLTGEELGQGQRRQVGLLGDLSRRLCAITDGFSQSFAERIGTGLVRRGHWWELGLYGTTHFIVAGRFFRCKRAITKDSF